LAKRFAFNPAKWMMTYVPVDLDKMEMERRHLAVAMANFIS